MSFRGALGATAAFCIVALASCEPQGADPGDTAAPEITSFTLESTSPTVRSTVRFVLEAVDDVAVTGYFVGESETPPTPGAALWQAARPDSISLTDPAPNGPRTLRAWAIDGAGNIGDSEEITVEHYQPGAALWSVRDAGSLPATACAVGTDSDGGVFVVGSTDSAHSGLDWRIDRYNPDGSSDPAWSKTFDGAGGDDIATSVAVFAPALPGSTPAIYVGGTREQSGHTDVWIKKFDEAGVEAAAGSSWDGAGWDKQIDARDLDPAVAAPSGNDALGEIVADGSGNVLVAASATNLVDIDTGLDWWITTFLASGVQNSDWQGRFYDGAGGDDAALSIAQQELDGGTNNFVFAGYATNLEAAASAADWWVRKFPPWQSEIVDPPWPAEIDPGNGLDDRATAVVADRSGGVYVGGAVGAGWEIRLYRDGHATPSWTVAAPAGESGTITALVLDGAGNLYAAGIGTEPGSTADYGWIRKYDTAGTEIADGWNKRIEDDSAIHDLEATDDGIVAVGVVAGDWWVTRYIDDRE